MNCKDILCVLFFDVSNLSERFKQKTSTSMLSSSSSEIICLFRFLWERSGGGEGTPNATVKWWVGLVEDCFELPHLKSSHIAVISIFERFVTTKETREVAKHQVINITPVGLMNNNSTNQLRSLRTHYHGRVGDIREILPYQLAKFGRFFVLQQKSREGRFNTLGQLLGVTFQRFNPT